MPEESPPRIFFRLLGIAVVIGILAYATRLHPGPAPRTTSPTTSSVVASPKVLIVPHHDLVSIKRSELFKAATNAGAKASTVVLISPNHYESGSGHIQTTNQSWETQNGIIQPDEKLIHSLKDLGVTEEKGSFSNEHGIRTVLPDIAGTFPKTPIVPLLISANTSLQEATDLADFLSKECVTCLVIASVDFSHYQPAMLADLHDRLTVRALENLDLNTLQKNAEVDSPMSLAAAARFADNLGAKKLVIKEQTNSGVLVSDLDTPGTTHLFAWYEPGEKATPKTSVSFLVGGDVMLDRSVANTYFFENNGRFTDVLKDFSERTFWGTDLGMINHEGPTSATPVDNNIQPNNLVFNFPPESVSVIKALNINVASLANNHSHNAGAAGLANTRKVLEAAQVTPLGGPGDSDISKTATIKGQGLNLHVVGVHALSGEPDVTSVIKSLKKTPEDRVLIMPHWGAEYQPTHSSSQAAMAHTWVNAGADLVIGAHPHVVQDSEIYKNVPIFYSLGNFIFDQWFSTETQRGMLIGGEFTNEGLRVFGLPITIKDSRPSLLTGTEKEQRLERIYTPLNACQRNQPYGKELWFPLSGE